MLDALHFVLAPLPSALPGREPCTYSRYVYSYACEKIVCLRPYLFVRAPFEHKLMLFAEEGRPYTVVEVWVRSEQY